MKNDKLNKENGNISKKAIIFSTLIILFSIVLVVLYFIFNTSNTPNTKETAKYEIPENAIEIFPDIALKIVYPFNAPKIKFYAYSDNTATELYSFVYLINNLDISSCDFIIYDNDGRSTFTMEDLNNSKEFTDIPLPQSWVDFYNDNDFADGNVSLKSFVSMNNASKIEENIDTFISNSELNKSVATNNELDNQTSIDDKNLESESTDELLDRFDYAYDENNHFTVAIFKEANTEKLKVAAYCDYSQDNLGLMQNDFLHIWMYPYSESIDIGLFVSVGEESYTYISDNGSVLMNTIPLESSKDIPESYVDRFEEMSTKLTDFYAKYGITDKTYNTLVYEDEKVKIFFSGITEDGVSFSVENMTDTNITIQATSISINGVSTNDIIMSDDVAPQSKGNVTARCDDFSPSTTVSTISGQLRVISFSRNFSSYDATFSNINTTGNSEQ